MVCKISIATKGAANKFTIGIKNINAPIIPNSQHGQNNSFLNSFTSIKAVSYTHLTLPTKA